MGGCGQCHSYNDDINVNKDINNIHDHDHDHDSGSKSFNVDKQKGNDNLNQTLLNKSKLSLNCESKLNDTVAINALEPDSNMTEKIIHNNKYKGNHLHSTVEESDNQTTVITNPCKSNCNDPNSRINIEMSRIDTKKQNKTSQSESVTISLFVGLSVHNILEGISIGLSPTYEKLIVITIGVCIHKLVDSFVLGMMILNSNWKDTKSYLFMFMFCLSGPLGVIIGFIAQNNVPLLIRAILTSLTVGTFLYISLTEIASHEFKNLEYKNIKMAGFVLGILLFAVFM